MAMIAQSSCLGQLHRDTTRTCTIWIWSAMCRHLLCDITLLISWPLQHRWGGPERLKCIRRKGKLCITKEHLHVHVCHVYNNSKSLNLSPCWNQQCTTKPPAFQAHYRVGVSVNFYRKLLQKLGVVAPLRDHNSVSCILCIIYATHPRVQLVGTAPRGVLPSPSHPNHQHRLWHLQSHRRECIMLVVSLLWHFLSQTQSTLGF